MLQFLVYSERPLRITEVVDALAVEPANTSQFNPLARLADPEVIFRCCPGFITVTNERNDRSRVEISLSHHSIRKFLNSYLATEDAKTTITEVCLAYLLQIEHSVPVKEVRQNYPLAQYAAQYWADHALNIEQRVQSSIMEFFESKESFRICYQLYSPDRPWRTYDEYGEPPPVLYYASFTGLAQSVQGLLDKGVNVNAHGGIYGNALQAASYKGHVEVLSLLLNRGADINIKGGKYANTFQAALQADRTPIIRALLDHGVNINLDDRIYSNTIQNTVWRKTHTDIIVLLQKREVNINTQESVYDSDVSQSTVVSIVSGMSNNSASTASTASNNSKLSGFLRHLRNPYQIQPREPLTNSEHPNDSKNSNQPHTKPSSSNDSTTLYIDNNFVSPDQKNVLDSTASSNLFQSLYQNAKNIIHSPESIEEALRASNKTALQRLISNRFD